MRGQDTQSCCSNLMLCPCIKCIVRSKVGKRYACVYECTHECVIYEYMIANVCLWLGNFLAPWLNSWCAMGPLLKYLYGRYRICSQRNFCCNDLRFWCFCDVLLLWHSMGTGSQTNETIVPREKSFAFFWWIFFVPADSSSSSRQNHFVSHISVSVKSRQTMHFLCFVFFFSLFKTLNGRCAHMASDNVGAFDFTQYVHRSPYTTDLHSINFMMYRSICLNLIEKMTDARLQSRNNNSIWHRWNWNSLV